MRPASRVIAFKDCFMGRTIAMSQIGDSAANRVGIPLSTLIDYMPFYDPAAAKRMGGGDVSGQTRFIDWPFRTCGSTSSGTPASTRVSSSNWCRARAASTLRAGVLPRTDARVQGNAQHRRVG